MYDFISEEWDVQARQRGHHAGFHAFNHDHVGMCGQEQEESIPTLKFKYLGPKGSHPQHLVGSLDNQVCAPLCAWSLDHLVCVFACVFVCV